MRLTGNKVIITGGAQGLGLAIAKAVVSEGASVSLWDVDEEALAAAERMVGEEHCETIHCDVRDVDAVRSAMGNRSSVDVLVNNAAVWTDNELDQGNPERRKLAFETNAVGPIQVTNEVLPLMHVQGSGHIFNVISVAGDGLSPSGDNRAWETYGATKWALTGYTKTLRESLAGTGIKVSGFFPGGIDTNFYENAGWPEGAHRQPWMMKADDVAEIVLFALTRPQDVLIESLTVTKFVD